MDSKYNIEQIRNDIESIKNLNKKLEEKIKDLNYVIGNLKLEYPDMLIYQKGKIYLNKDFNFEKSFVKKEEVIEMVNLLRELSRDFVSNKLLIKDVEDTIEEMNKKDDE